MRPAIFVLALAASAVLAPSALADDTCVSVTGVGVACADPERGVAAELAVDAYPFVCVPESPCPGADGGFRAILLRDGYYLLVDFDACARGPLGLDVGTCSLAGPA